MAFSFGQPSAGPSATQGIGAQNPSPFTFGGANKQPQQQQPQAQQAQQQPQQSFGGGLFGSGFQSQPTGTSSSLFPPNASQTAGASPFGNPAPQSQQPATSSLFGQAQNPAANSTNGAATQQQQSQQPFGQSTFGSSSGLFGQSTQAQQSNPLTLSQLSGPASYQQQAQKQQQPGLGLFGSSISSSALGASTAKQHEGADGNANKRLGLPVNDKLTHIRDSWNVQNLQTCQFLYYFYNAIPSQPADLGEMALRDPNFGRRKDAVGPRHDALWLQTLRENPDRAKFVPVLAAGFPDLQARIAVQQAETERQNAKLSELQKRFDGLTAKHTLSNSVRISAISRKQTSLHHRLLGFAKRIHLLIPALRGHSITLNEEQLKSLLHMCETELGTISSLNGANPAADSGSEQGAAVHHRLRGRINELWALLGTLKSKREATLAASKGNAPLEWAVVDEDAINDVVKILASQQQGLDHLSSTLQTDVNVLDTIIKGLEGVELIGIR